MVRSPFTYCGIASPLVWPRLIAVYPPYQEYQARTDRDIPVVVLKPA